jgi:hypothetical protein
MSADLGEYKAAIADVLRATTTHKRPYHDPRARTPERDTPYEVTTPTARLLA